MTVAIRPHRPEDMPAMHAIREAAFAPVFASFRAIVGPAIADVAFATAEAEQGAHLDDLCARHDVFVAEQDGAIVGFVAVILDDTRGLGELGLNAVDPAHARQGIGTALYEHALDHMRASGMKVATVGTGGDASHAPARAAYGKVGFEVGVPSIYLYRRL